MQLGRRSSISKPACLPGWRGYRTWVYPSYRDHRRKGCSRLVKVSNWNITELIHDLVLDKQQVIAWLSCAIDLVILRYDLQSAPNAAPCMESSVSRTDHVRQYTCRTVELSSTQESFFHMEPPRCNEDEGNQVVI